MQKAIKWMSCFIAVNGRGEVFFSVFLISFGLKADGVFLFCMFYDPSTRAESTRNANFVVCSTTKTSLSSISKRGEKLTNSE